MRRGIPIEYLFAPLCLSASVAIPVMFAQSGAGMLLAGILILSYAAIYLANPRTGIICFLMFLLVHAEIRRLVGYLSGFPANDPLLLVEPAVTLIILATLLIRRKLVIGSRLSKMIFGLLVIMAVQVFNPLQGGLAVGIGGALFYIVPLLWYWIGRQHFDEQLLRELAFGLVVPFGALAAILGLYQTFYGYFPWEQAWLELTSWSVSLSHQGTTRAVSFFSSPGEYSKFLAIVIVVIWCGWLTSRSLWVVALPILGVALYFESGRASVLAAVGTMVAVWTLLGRKATTWAPRLILAGLLSCAGLYYVATESQEAAKGTSAQWLVDHQSQGLMNPLDEKQSTGKVHAAMVGYGILDGLTNPIGRGLGATTLAAARFGGEITHTEIDFSNMFVSLGAVGGFLFIAIIFIGLKRSIGYWVASRRMAGLLIFGVLFCSFGSWLGAGEYAKNPFIWVFLGALDRLYELHLGMNQNARRVR